MAKAHQLYSIDLSGSFIVGDYPSDLLTGHGEKHKDEISKETVICSDLLEAAKCIIVKK